MFEGDTLEKYEAFLLHLLPSSISQLHLVFVGQDLNNENLPLDLISHIKPCKKCRRAQRKIIFDFQCKTLYQNYSASSCYTNPDIVCLFHPAFHYSKDSPFNTWPYAVRAALNSRVPIVVTSYTDLESSLDFNTFEEYAKYQGFEIDILKRPSLNLFRSKKPERNFGSEEIGHMIFKNQTLFCVRNRSK